MRDTGGIVEQINPAKLAGPVVIPVAAVINTPAAVSENGKSSSAKAPSTKPVVAKKKNRAKTSK